MGAENGCNKGAKEYQKWNRSGAAKKIASGAKS